MPSVLDKTIIDVEVRAREIGTGYDVMADALKVAAEAGSASLVAGAGEGAVEAATTAAAALSVGLGLVILAILLAVLLFCRQLQHGFISMFAWMPFGIGPKVRDAINFAFHPVDMFHDYVLSVAEQTAEHAVAGLVEFIGWAITKSGVGEHTNIGALIHAQVDPVHKEVDHLWSWVSQINRGVDELWKTVLAPGTSSPAIPDSILEQIHELQSKYNEQEKAIAGMETAVFNLARSVGILTDDFNSLSGKVHGARAVNTGWQDIEHELEKFRTSVEHQIAMLQPQVQENTRNIAGLASLGVLVEPGMRGIMNLRRLEDNPCQCPKIRHIPNELGTALAVYEFIENG